jgi:hypothetical protein
VQTVVRKLINDCLADYNQQLHVPKLVLSIQHRLATAHRRKEKVDFSKITRDDPEVVNNQWYKEGSVTPRSGSPRSGRGRSAAVKVEVDDEAELGEVEDGDGKVRDEEEDVAGSRSGQPPRMSEKAKGKRRAESPRRSTAESDGEGPSDAVVERPTKRSKAASNSAGIEGVSGAAEVIGAGEACARCQRRVMQCVRVAGRACQGCNKSKVKCSLYVSRVERAQSSVTDATVPPRSKSRGRSTTRAAEEKPARATTKSRGRSTTRAVEEKPGRAATKSRGRSSARVVEEEPGKSTAKSTEAKGRVAKGMSKAKTSTKGKKGKNQVYFKIHDLAHIAINRFCSGSAIGLVIPRQPSDSDATD